MSEQTRAHWRDVWADTAPDEVSWFQPEPAVSLALIADLDLSKAARIVDVGGGASRLVDRLLDDGYSNVTVLDIAEPALARARERLGDRADGVDWLVGDVLEAEFEPGIDLWHDRAVFHFLTDAEDRARYAERLDQLLSPEGTAIVATFSPEGPERCSGLPVRRYDAEALSAELGESFRLVHERREAHETPWGDTQSFAYAVLERE